MDGASSTYGAASTRRGGLGALAVTVDWLKRDADFMKAMLVRRA